MGAKKKEVRRVVFDTSVLVSALLFKGELSPLVDAWERGDMVILFSKDTFDDLRNVLGYPKFSLTEEEVLTILQEKVLPYCEVVDVVNDIESHCEDPAQDKFIRCAVSGAAHFFVDGDSPRCNGRKHRMMKIIRPSELLSQVHSTMLVTAGRED